MPAATQGITVIVGTSIRGGAMSGDDRTAGSVSRRRMLKRLGATGALMWSVPALTSISAPAYAQASPQCGLLTGGSCGPGSPDPRCNEAGCPPLSPNCWCGRMLDGSCFCTSGGVCNPTGSPICEIDAHCESLFAPGFKCAELDPCTGNICSGRRVCVSPCAPGRGPQRAPHREGIITVFAN
jgi:hypothetical protein